MRVTYQSALRVLELPERYLRQIAGILAAYLPEAEIWAYGSRVAGTSHEASDLDLVARDPAKLSRPQPRLALARTALSESTVPIRVDLADWARLPEHFRQEIEKNYTVLQKPGNRA